MQEPTYKEVCETMKLDFQCAKCGCKLKGACRNCQVSFNHWKECYEEAKQLLIKRANPTKKEKSNGKPASEEIDEFLKSIDF